MVRSFDEFSQKRRKVIVTVDDFTLKNVDLAETEGQSTKTSSIPAQENVKNGWNLNKKFHNDFLKTDSDLF